MKGGEVEVVRNDGWVSRGNWEDRGCEGKYGEVRRGGGGKWGSSWGRDGK